ncbi:hypothetical protein RAB80_002660 [Fusarium oxysporum f. sp. vasinfectum]|nr:hypothetical protein RAB80_002660 [Fusarium oxysporum f. sp. vasinfectum]
MAARKLAQEVDKCFKKVSEGVAEFEAIYEKIEQSSNPAQKDKLEDNLKREIKKLQRLRDQIKTWAASNDIKDKAPLLEHRKLIETQMEKFKAVEKAMKTKAYSKEGLSAAAKLDPKEQAKVEASEFLSGMVDELEQQIETLEAEGESIQATMKKGKNNTAKAERIAEVERIIERHKWHQGKLELIRRSLENGGVEPEQVTDLEESIRYYVSDGMNEDFMEDEEMYEELDLEDEEGTYGMGADNEKNSSLDAQSVQEDLTTDNDLPKTLTRKAQKEADPVRRTSSQTKSPLPALATLHAPLPTISNSNSGTPAMKPASVPTRPAGEGLKYASAAAAAAASDKNNSKRSKAAGKQAAVLEAAPSSKAPRTNGTANGVKQTEEEEECIYHLPASLQDLVDTYETSRKRPYPPSAPSALRMMTASQASCPDIGQDFPREPLAIFDDPRLYSRMDPDTLFYVFYYKQGTAQQYMAAKALKDQSWRFHKQYQTWFQRHEEPKNITEDFEQGTYRFFDYESTWMNRRKADFKFVYKFLEDEV